MKGGGACNLCQFFACLTLSRQFSPHYLEAWNRLLNSRIAFPSSRRVVIRYYRLIIQIFSVAICRYEMMRLCWLENPLMRPTFAEITKRFQYYLREYKVLS